MAADVHRKANVRKLPQPESSTAAMLLPSITLSARANNFEAKSGFWYAQKY